MDKLMRRNPRKLAMPVLKDTACTAGTVGALALANINILPRVGTNNAALLVGAELVGAIAMSNRYPCASASAAGALLSALMQTMAATVTGDYGLIAWNPDMERALTSPAEYAGMPDTLRYALGG